MAAQFTHTKGLPQRGLRAWMVWATTSLPVPLSPRRSTVASVWLTRRTTFITSRMAALSPTTVWRVPSARRRRTFSSRTLSWSLALAMAMAAWLAMAATSSTSSSVKALVVSRVSRYSTPSRSSWMMSGQQIIERMAKASMLSDGPKRSSALASSLNTGPPEPRASSMMARLTTRSPASAAPWRRCRAAGTQVSRGSSQRTMAPCSAGTTSKIVARIRSSSSGCPISLLIALPTS